MTIGDILAVIAAVMLVAASWAAALMLTALLFQTAVARAQTTLVLSPGKCTAIGLAVTLTVGVVGLKFAHTPGPLRLAAYATWALLAVVAAIGSAAVVDLMAKRIDGIGADMAPFARLTRAVALYVGAGFVPVFGWFLITPIAALASIGAGLAALSKQPPPRSPLPSATDGVAECPASVPSHPGESGWGRELDALPFDRSPAAGPEAWQ